MFSLAADERTSWSRRMHFYSPACELGLPRVPWRFPFAFYSAYPCSAELPLGCSGDVHIPAPSRVDSSFSSRAAWTGRSTLQPSWSSALQDMELGATDTGAGHDSGSLPATARRALTSPLRLRKIHADARPTPRIAMRSDAIIAPLARSALRPRSKLQLGTEPAHVCRVSKSHTRSSGIPARRGSRSSFTRLRKKSIQPVFCRRLKPAQGRNKRAYRHD